MQQVIATFFAFAFAFQEWWKCHCVIRCEDGKLASSMGSYILCVAELKNT
jgi:hypothetical protein